MEKRKLLEPCPFCGGAVKIKVYPSWDEKRGLVYGAMIHHGKTAGTLPDTPCVEGMDSVGIFTTEKYGTELEAHNSLADAWNTRAEV